MIDNIPLLSDHSLKKEDCRGYLEILYESSHVVLKRSFSKKGVFRGMHLQLPPHEQTKIIRVISGRIIDFVAEIKSEGSYIHWKEVDATCGWLKIDSKLAHGFYAVEDAIFEYICEGAYDESAEQSYSITKFLEEKMSIVSPLLSEKDARAPQLNINIFD